MNHARHVIHVIHGVGNLRFACQFLAFNGAASYDAARVVCSAQAAGGPRGAGRRPRAPRALVRPGGALPADGRTLQTLLATS